MKISSHRLSIIYKNSRNLMRDVDGLQPQEAFDELLKYLFLLERAHESGYKFPDFCTTVFNNNIVSLNKALADDMRHQLKVYLHDTNVWYSNLWQDKEFHLSDAALLSVHELFEDINFCTIDIDTRSSALNEFVPSELRKGLGIFPTPDGIARMMVTIAAPSITSTVFDPACGTGTFLLEVIQQWGNNRFNGHVNRIWGADKNARMLVLSDINLGHVNGIEFRRSLADSLNQPPQVLFNELDEGFDYIFTNPPFGVTIDQNKYDMSQFQTCRADNGGIVKRQQSEVIFAEQCIRYLKPGGMLCIVLPRSVVTNSSLRSARSALNELGYLEAVVSLPPETFIASGTHTNTVALFIRRYRSESEKHESSRVVVSNIDNVGFDTIGRPRKGSQLECVAESVSASILDHKPRDRVSILPNVSKNKSIVNLPDVLSHRIASSYGDNFQKLKEIVSYASNGRTPGRANYSSDGLFLVKVGNLTGRGINWHARYRNFISGTDEVARRKNTRLMLEQNDILLTSSAHSPKYIAKKIDLVSNIPMQVGGAASFVGEVMMLRVKDWIDPLILMAYLRLPSTQQRIQLMIRGQTAHLYPEDLLELPVPKQVADPSGSLQKLADLIKRESLLFEEMNGLAFEQRELSLTVEKMLVG